ncbi:hypothetical protein HUZ36_04650 [Pseudoalteromonas sp. McH1-7]|uniref:hypothetical protein n=1 Tax=Pseudoalteromonas sp. McH1-7 TaxID=2745574 RepID=UPI00159125B7|nr:hypothetical protein [Pseudoalteromonas sp. McH1-7]NUZ10063.1 hypothetical protein [Pseudoalteromonas sp. McH1-7]
MSTKNTGDFFVMLTTQTGGYTPLMLCTDIEYNREELAKFKTKEAAKSAAESSVLGENFGYEVFEIGYGC